MQKTFDQMPDKPQLSTVNSNVGKDTPPSNHNHGAPLPPTEASSFGKKFFALFQKAEDKSEAQTSLPNYMDYSQISEPRPVALPRVTDTKEEKAAKLEDQERRDAYILEDAKKKEDKKETKDHQEAHKKYVALFGELPKST